jgi:phosphoglycerate kinase
VMSWKTLCQMDLHGKRVLTRVDLNVPMVDGKITDATRIEKIVPTINEITKKGGTPILLAHMGRPKGKRHQNLSLSQLQEDLETYFKSKVIFAADCIGPSAETALQIVKKGEIILLENTRFYPEEEENNPKFAASLAALADLFCNDAFSASHRAHASTTGLARYLPSCAGKLMEAELKALESVLGQPERPVASVVGGAKVSTKIALLENLIEKVDCIIIGGAMANTFLFSKGFNVGRSLVEESLKPTALKILNKAEKYSCKVILPTDVIIAKELSKNTPTSVVSANECPENYMILDAGPSTVDNIKQCINSSKTLLWNGPLGAFEVFPFDEATSQAAKYASERTKNGDLISVAGGGDTVAALNKAGVTDSFTYVSTAGGAFLEWLEGKELPGVACLTEN